MNEKMELDDLGKSMQAFNKSYDRAMAKIHERTCKALAEGQENVFKPEREYYVLWVLDGRFQGPYTLVEAKQMKEYFDGLDLKDVARRESEGGKTLLFEARWRAVAGNKIMKKVEDGWIPVNPNTNE